MANELNKLYIKMVFNNGNILEKSSDYTGSRTAKLNEILSAVRATIDIDNLRLLKLRLGTNGYDFIKPYTQLDGLVRLQSFKLASDFEKWKDDISEEFLDDVRKFEAAINYMIANWFDSEFGDINESAELLKNYPFAESFDEMWNYDAFDSVKSISVEPETFRAAVQQFVQAFQDMLDYPVDAAEYLDKITWDRARTIIEPVTIAKVKAWGLDFARYQTGTPGEDSEGEVSIKDIKLKFEQAVLYMTDEWSYSEIGDLNDNIPIIEAYPFSKSFDELWNFNEFTAKDHGSIMGMEEAFENFRDVIITADLNSMYADTPLREYLKRISNSEIDFDERTTIHKVLTWCEIVGFQF